MRCRKEHGAAAVCLAVLVNGCGPHEAPGGRGAAGPAHSRRVGRARPGRPPCAQRQLGSAPLTPDNVKALTPPDQEAAQAKQLYLVLAQRGATKEVIADALNEIQARLDYELNTDYDPRSIVGDNYADVHQSDYGNTNVMGPDAKHGSHVTGIVHSIDSSAVRIMMVRAVPDGDERDKDIANAIRFAVDHGARVINMSFGKGYSPEKFAVDEAVRYADAHNVLMVHAAGNDGQDLASHPNFPTPAYADSGHARNWIEVGASSWQGGDTLAASFSNYGHDQVDVFGARGRRHPVDGAEATNTRRTAERAWPRRS